MKVIFALAAALASASLYGQTAAPSDAGTVTGKVGRFLLAPRGEVDGFLLQDGTRVQFPPHLATELTALVQPNDTVVVTTLAPPAALGTFGRGVRASAIKNQRSGRSIVDRPPATPPAPPSEARATLDARGKVAKILLNDRGDADGLVLVGGDEVRFPPAVGASVLAQYKQNPQATMMASGPGTTTAYGKVLDAVTLAYNGHAVPIAELAEGPGAPPRAGEGRLPPPPPPGAEPNGVSDPSRPTQDATP